MKVAIPLWQGRVSPVFDEASRILLVDVSDQRELRRQEESLVLQNPFDWAQLLPKIGVGILICGMISQHQQKALASTGIRVIPHICGSIEEVVSAFLNGRLEDGSLFMPGCRSHRILQGRRCRVNRKKVQE